MSFPQTPAPAVPGAFLNTPAIASRFNAQEDSVRRRLFSQASAPAAGQLSNVANDDASKRPSQAPPSPQPPLAKAASFVNNALTRDEHYPELDSYCRQISSDYELPTIDSAWAPFQKIRQFQIPQSVLQQLNGAELQTTMGLFAEINHAWVLIDNFLYMWDYTHPNPELIGYEESQHSINCVKLVPPKPGVFNSVIKHVLVVATTHEITLLGVAVQETGTGSRKIDLYGTKMQMGMRGMEAGLIVGTGSGRIFFTAARSDSDIYELYYQQEEKWFSSRTGRINHTYPGWSTVMPNPSHLFFGKSNNEHVVDLVVDESRNLLYSLSNTSTVRTYHMEAPNKLTEVIQKTKNDFLRDIAHALSVVSPLLGERMEIVSISPISATEDNKVHLMALTNTGCRLFMSATSASSYMLGSSSQAPQSMQLQSIKFPPSEGGQRRSRLDQFSGPGEPVNVQSKSLENSRRGIRFPPGYFLDLIARPEQPNKDLLFISAPDSGRIKNSSRTQTLRYYEQATWIELGGRAVDIGLVSKPFAATNQPMGFGNELAVQFDNSNGSEFAVLTNSGVYIIRRRRLTDILASVIKSSSGDEGLKADVNKFQSAYGRVETLTAALAVVCRQGDSGHFSSGHSAIDQITLDRAKQVFINFGGNPMLPEQDGQPATIEMVRPSSRHGAITMYLSRLIRSLWKSKVISVSSNGAGALVVNSTISQTKLRDVQDCVMALKDFLNNNRPFIQGLSGPSDLRQAATKQEELAFQGEHHAMHAVEALMMDIVEGISFVMTLFEERVTDIYTRLDEASRQGLRDLTYERLFSQTPGKELAKVLVKAIVNRNIENGSNVETVAEALRRKCGSFCSADDVVIFKAQEQLKRASEPSLNPNVSRTLLHDSLKHFRKVAGSLTHANLESAVQQYIQLRYYAGAIQLCLVVAEAKDRSKSALHWVNDGKPAGDSRAKAFEERRICYYLIRLILLDLDAASAKEPELVDGKPTLMATKRAEAYDVVNSSNDEVFHTDLYEWYIEEGWTERLLSIESPYVTTFLSRLSSQDATHAELLCRFYTMRGRYFDAAEVQYRLAKSDFDLSIKNRLYLLSRAKTNASVMTAGVSRQKQQLLNHEVTDLLEVANIQDDLLGRLMADDRVTPELLSDFESKLGGKIQNLSSLYNEFVSKAGYYDLSLIIYHVSDFRNATTIGQTWTSFIEQTHTEVQERRAAYEAHFLETGDGSVDAPPQPYETLIAQIETICHRCSNDSSVFPVTFLLPELCKYALVRGQDGRISADVHWPIDLFLHLGISHDLIVRILGRMFEAQEVPFRGIARARLVEWISHAAGRWVRDLSRHGRPDARLEPWVGELITECDKWVAANTRNYNEGGADLQDLSRMVKNVRRSVEALVEISGSRSIGFF
ncbi:nucleoporin-domain-containing protein [Xylaria sp. CBS 124048]|nr:nucleoporin-domain-containing protein [Xylaria sp. CBS 124048]